MRMHLVAAEHAALPEQSIALSYEAARPSLQTRQTLKTNVRSNLNSTAMNAHAWAAHVDSGNVLTESSRLSTARRAHQP
eukprot:127910-Pleurochrysis_carterae.AAC.4